jgi:hypothetical protein
VEERVPRSGRKGVAAVSETGEQESWTRAKDFFRAERSQVLGQTAGCLAEGWVNERAGVRVRWVRVWVLWEVLISYVWLADGW